LGPKGDTGAQGPAGPAGAGGTAVPVCVTSEGNVTWGVCGTSEKNKEHAGTTYYMMIKS
jgi:hypothetical protein